MKTILAILIATAGIAQANLIDLTPGGFSLLNPFPPAVIKFFNTPQLTRANIVNGQPQWVSGEPFGPANFGIQINGASADVSWNLLNTNGFFTKYVFLEGPNFMANLYTTTGPVDFWRDGSGTVTIDGMSSIISITFSGRNSIPDSGSALEMLAISTTILLLSRRSQCVAKTFAGLRLSNRFACQR